MPSLDGPIQEAPRAIIFDIGRVIIPVDMARSFQALARPEGSSHLHALHALESDPRWLDWQEGRMDPQEWHEYFSRKLGLAVGFDEFCRIWCSVLDPQILLPERLFETLAPRCRLALLSNTDPIHVAHIEATYSFVRHFPVRVYSCHVGASKPGPVIYHHALRELGALASETMFIDDVRDNAAGAASQGITGFHFTSADELLSELSRLGLWAG